MNIYNILEKPILSLAPMEDVTDTVFRQIVSSIKRPDLFYTEFVNVEGLNSEGKEKVIHRLNYSKEEKPIVAQLWGINPENFFKASKLVKDLGFDGVDINMGCSVKKVTEKEAGSGLILADRGRVKDIIDAVRDGASDLPISVKTRLGWEEYQVNDWIQFLLEQRLDVLTVHFRTARGANCLNANWEMANEVINLRNEISPNTLIFGNGDIKSLEQAKEYAKEYIVDGVMIGRAVINNPWFFSGKEDISISEKISILKKHIELFSTVSEERDFNGIKKFFKAYISDFDGAVEIRKSLMVCNSASEALKILDSLNIL